LLLYRIFHKSRDALPQTQRSGLRKTYAFAQ
jgi:hypothetical protein